MGQVGQRGGVHGEAMRYHDGETMWKCPNGCPSKIYPEELGDRMLCPGCGYWLVPDDEYEQRGEFD